MKAGSVRRAEARMQRLLLRALGVVAAASPLAVAMVLNAACSSLPADSDASADAGACGRRQVQYDASDDGGGACETFFQQPCGQPQGVTGVALCQYLPQDCEVLCGPGYNTCYAVGDWCKNGAVTAQDPDASPLIVQCGLCPNGGRRPSGLASAPAQAHVSAVGDYFAQAAHLEAASIAAFRILRREIASYGAPADLLDAARRAEADEVKHTRMTTKIARAHGGKRPKVRLAPSKSRSLEAIAIENVVEGCVRETFAALVALWQADHAADPHIAAAMKEIAVDESRHAALAWSVAAWADPLLDAGARKRVEAAKLKAICDLEKEIETEPHPDLVVRAGLPRPRDQVRLLAQMLRELGVTLAAA